jgi:hypothetical protein
VPGLGPQLRGSCAADQFCVARVGGAFNTSCEPNPCGDGPITGECACALCGGAPCTVGDRTVVCDTCSDRRGCA